MWVARKPGDDVAIGTFVKINALETMELIAAAGFDFVVIDTEHALLSVRDVYEMTVAFTARGVRVVVRIPDHSYGDAQRYLDAGADGVMVPHVESPEQARAIMPRLVFPPHGTRGAGFNARAGLWGRAPAGMAGYLAGGDEVARIAMIEDAAAIDRVADIAGEEGVDALFIGPGDLSVSMGLPMGHPDVDAAVTRAIAAAVAADVPVGTLVSSAEDAARRADDGAGFLLVGSDTGAFGSAIAGLRGSVSTPTVGARPAV